MRRTSDRNRLSEPGHRGPRVEAVVAVRGGPAAKTRLGARLDPAAREALVAAMLADMLSALARAPSIRQVRVTTPTPALAAAALAAGARVIDEPEAGDLNAAFDAVRRDIAAEDPDRLVLLLPGDLPLLDPPEIDLLAAAAGPGRIALAPAQADGGTAALIVPAGMPLELAFGANSFERHLAAADRLGVVAEVRRLPGLGLDIDRPADIDAFRARGGGGQTARTLDGQLRSGFHRPLDQGAAA
jgi:2-phospho-L-lactate guanylyltransferase